MAAAQPLQGVSLNLLCREITRLKLRRRIFLGISSVRRSIAHKPNKRSTAS